MQRNLESWHGFGNIGCTLLKSQENPLGMVALSLCCVASAQINILSVIVFPQEPQSLKKYIFFFFFALQNGIQVSVLHKFAAVSKTFLHHI